MFILLALLNLPLLAADTPIEGQGMYICNRIQVDEKEPGVMGFEEQFVLQQEGKEIVLTGSILGHCSAVETSDHNVEVFAELKENSSKDNLNADKKIRFACNRLESNIIFKRVPRGEDRTVRLSGQSREWIYGGVTRVEQPDSPLKLFGISDYKCTHISRKSGLIR
jgi:hypothetical protein